MTNQKIKVIIADDHHLVLDGLEALIQRTDDIEVLEMAYNGHHALKLLQKYKEEVDIAILDIEMPVMDGLEATKKIMAKDQPFGEVKVLILTMYNNETFIKEIIQAEAKGYILKNRSSKELINAIRAIYYGGEFLSKAVTDTLIESVKSKKSLQHIDKLTNREVDVLRLIGKGYTTPEISEKLSIAPSTVDTHRRHLIEKLNVKNSKELVRYAVEKGY